MMFRFSQLEDFLEEASKKGWQLKIFTADGNLYHISARDRYYDHGIRLRVKISDDYDISAGEIIAISIKPGGCMVPVVNDHEL